jgi:hypothetical protein
LDDFSRHRAPRGCGGRPSGQKNFGSRRLPAELGKEKLLGEPEHAVRLVLETIIDRCEAARFA